MNIDIFLPLRFFEYGHCFPKQVDYLVDILIILYHTEKATAGIEFGLDLVTHLFVNYHALKGVASCFIPPLLR
jgi:hypothetical protein